MENQTKNLEALTYYGELKFRYEAETRTNVFL